MGDRGGRLKVREVLLKVCSFTVKDLQEKVEIVAVRGLKFLSIAMEKR